MMTASSALVCLTLTASLLAPLKSAAVDAVCNGEAHGETTREQIECNTQVTTRAEAQLKKDFAYLTGIAKSRDKESVKYFKMGHLAFQNYLLKNCESEGHDAFGGTLQDVLEQKCKRDTVLARHRLFERIGEAHPFGSDGEKIFGRPICSAFNDESKPVEIGTTVNVGDVESLRKKLDRIGAGAAATGIYLPAIATLMRAVHTEAESQRRLDATYTCLGIMKGFCADLQHADKWISRCQTEIRGAFYRRATMRLRLLNSDE